MAVHKPIPIPWRQRWREFRVSYLPLLMFTTLMLCIGVLWTRYVHPSTIVGEVESLHFPVVSTLPGTVESLHVSLLQSVTNGQLLAVVSVTDPGALQAQLQAVEADLRLLQARMAFDHSQEVDARRRLRLDLMTERINLGLAQVHLRQAESEYERVKDLFQQSLVPKGLNLMNEGAAGRFDYGYDVALRDRDSLRTEVEERKRVVTDMETELAANAAGHTADPAQTAVENAIRAQQLVLEQTLKPLMLRATVDGFVSGVSNRPGDRIVAGRPLLMLSAQSNDRVIAWVRPPVTAPPKVGDRVLVRRMDVGRVSTTGTVIEVGRQLETLSATLQPPGGNAVRVEVGLPILVRLADPGDLLPGEPVQLELSSPASRATN